VIDVNYGTNLHGKGPTILVGPYLM
jgi:hypothetical protein